MHCALIANDGWGITIESIIVRNTRNSDIGLAYTILIKTVCDDKIESILFIFARIIGERPVIVPFLPWFTGSAYDSDLWIVEIEDCEACVFLK